MSITNIITKELEKHFITHHMNRYILTLTNKDYCEVMGITKNQSQQHIRLIWDMRLKYSQFDEIVNGKRRKKVNDLGIKLFDRFT